MAFDSNDFVAFAALLAEESEFAMPAGKRISKNPKNAV